MASALLVGRNELDWGESRVALMSKAPNHRPPNPNANPNPNPSPPPSDTSSAAPCGGCYVTLRPAGLPRREARETISRLTGELGQVRGLLARIDEWERKKQRLEAAAPSPPPPPPPPPVAASKLRSAAMKKCSQILTKLKKNKKCVWFNAPVDVEGMGLHDYFAIIKTPMDLGTVRQKLMAGRYPSHVEFAADVRLTFSNALRYNPVGHEVHTFAGQLLASFDEMFKPVVAWFEQESLLLEPMPLPLVPPPPPQPQLQPPPPRIVQPKLPKPKARDLNKRAMSLEEKHKLRLGLESLPTEKMTQVLQIVRKRQGDPELNGDEIELDIEVMDVETLWELDRFVGNCKKAISKNRRLDAVVRGAAMYEDSTAVTVAVPSTIDAAAPVHAPIVVDIGDSENEIPGEKGSRGGEPVDEYVDIGDEMPTVNYQSVEIEKDDAGVASSSSGSSGSSSSSSDSDSGSSADSDSDRDDARSPA